MARRRFFVDSFTAGFAVLDGEDAQHLARVLRAQTGQLFELSDNRSVQLGEIVEASPKSVRFRLIEPIASEPPPVRVTLVASLIKFDRFEWMVEKATELGVEAILPVEAERTERGLLAAAAKRVERWRKIARESSQQSRRSALPVMLTPAPLDRLTVGGCAFQWFLDENPSAPPFVSQLPTKRPAEPVALLIGPEGGWTEAERERLGRLWTPGSLGTQILRAETAALAGLAVLMNFWQPMACRSGPSLRDRCESTEP